MKQAGRETELKGLRVALVGGAGFIGHHLALALVARGAEVSVIDNLQGGTTGSRRSQMPVVLERLARLDQAGVRLFVQDAREYMPLGPLLNRTIVPQVVVNLATCSQGAVSQEVDLHSNFEHSLRTLENVLDTCRGHPRHLIYLSSHWVYGHQATDQVEEEVDLDPLGIEGAVKLTGEKMVIAYHQVFDLEYTIVRTAFVYGPRHLSQRLGPISIRQESDRWILEVAAGPDHRQDFTYVDDLVEGLCLLVRHPRARNQTFNLTSAQCRRMDEFASILKDLLPRSEVSYRERDPIACRRGCLSIAKAREYLGFQPRVSLEEGLARWVEWSRTLVGAA